MALCAILHASTVAGLWLVDFHDLYASVGSHTAIGVTIDVTNVLTVLGSKHLLLAENTSLRLGSVSAVRRRWRNCAHRLVGGGLFVSTWALG